MTRIPDRFDLLVRKVRDGEMTPERQFDFLMSAIFTLKEVHLINNGGEVTPIPAFVELDGQVLMPVFSSADQADTYSIEREQRNDNDPLGLISMKPAYLLEYAKEFIPYGCKDWIINPGPYGFILSLDSLQGYYEEFRKQAEEKPDGAGFWIPNMSTEEEDFWLENGL